MLQEIPLALAMIRNGRGQCPREIVTFLSNLLKYNDNRENQVCAMPLKYLKDMYMYVCYVELKISSLQ